MPHEPLFQENILATILRNFSFYFNDGYWGIALSVILLLVLSQYLWVKNYTADTYHGICFPSSKYLLNPKSKSDRIALSVFAITFAAICLVFFSLEMSLFANFDLMHEGTTINFIEGHGTGISDIRFAPLANIELNLFYAISHNLYIVTGLVLIETAFLLYLLYKLFDFIPAAPRLYALAAIMVLPAFFWVNNPVFPERLMMILVCGSLIMLKKYLSNPNKLTLLKFILLMNLALYSKETVILFYAGILAVNILYFIFSGKIILKSFIHPFKTARTFPVEYLMFCSMLIFSLLYLLLGVGIHENEYVKLHSFNNTWHIYTIETALIIISGIGLLRHKNIIIWGLWGGSLLLLLMVALVLNISGINGKALSYYAIIPALFGCLIAVYSHPRKYKLILIPAVILAIFNDFGIYQKQNGKFYRETAEFLAQQKSTQGELQIFLADSLNGLYKPYITDCYLSAYKYYFPDWKVTFKSNDLKNFHPADKVKHAWKYQEVPAAGDIYIENKFYSPNHPENYQKVFENKLFRIFEIRP